MKPFTLKKEKEKEEKKKEEKKKEKEKQILRALRVLETEIEQYSNYANLNDPFLTKKLKELEALKKKISIQFGNKYNSNLRKIGRLITRKQLEKLNVIDNIIDPPLHPDPNLDQDQDQMAVDEMAAVEKAYIPNTPLIDARKRIIDAEFTGFGSPPPPPPPPGNLPAAPDDPYQGYLNTFDGHRIFTLRSETFVQDTMYNIGAYNSGPNPYKKYYDRGDFDTECLLLAIIFRILIDIQFHDSEINKLISSYTHDPDPDDLYDEAENDIFGIFTVYGIVKRITAFIKSGNLDASMRYLRALKEWISEEDPRGENPGISQLLLKRIGIMTELLWYVLSIWPVVIPDPQESMVEPYNVKLYAGIGTQTSDANYEIFVAGLFNNIAEHTPPRCFHNEPDPPQYPQLQQIISRDFVSTAYSFDAAAKFCKILGCGQQGVTNIFCMLEFILEPGKQLPFIGSSANEAEVLLKPGNIYRFIKRYKVQYVRLSRGNDEPMIIYIYQFLLVDDQNTRLYGPQVNYDQIVSRKKRSADEIKKSDFNFNNHPDWSITINAFIDEFSRSAKTPLKITSTQEVVDEFGGSKKTRQTKRRRQTNKKLRMKRQKRKTNKRRCKKSRRI